MPLMLFDRCQVQLSRNLSRCHAALQVLLVGVDQNIGLAQLLVIQHGIQLFPNYTESLSICTVYDHNDKLGVCVISGPGGPQTLLAA